MRQGCISLGKIECSGCHNNIPYADRYLLINEENGVEVESGPKMYYCVDCCLKKGYAQYREEKGELVLTFFPGELPSVKQDVESSSERENGGE